VKSSQHEVFSSGRFGKFCLLSFLLAACLSAQDRLNPVVKQLDGALRSGNNTEAELLSKRLLSADESADTLLAAGVLLAQHEKLPDAAAIFERCSLRYPASFEAKYNLALARIGLAEYPRALQTLNSISPRTTDERAAVEYLTGKTFLATNHLREAQKSLAAAYAHSPKEENYALDLALLYIRSAAYVPAIEILQPSLAAHPNSEDSALELALADVLAGRYSDGIHICHKLQQQDPTLSVPRLIAAFSYCTQKDYKACETESSAGIAAAHPHPYLYYLRARALWESGTASHTQMLDDVTKAIQQMPGCSVCLLLRSSIFEASHDNRAAIADLKEAVQKDAQPASTWYRLSMLYRKAGMPAEASAALERYRSIHDRGASQEVESFRKQFLAGVPPQPTQ
jgi:tetratricopeptide (TPR) repeat protein